MTKEIWVSFWLWCLTEDKGSCILTKTFIDKSGQLYLEQDNLQTRDKQLAVITEILPSGTSYNLF